MGDCLCGYIYIYINIIVLYVCVIMIVKCNFIPGFNDDSGNTCSACGMKKHTQCCELIYRYRYHLIVIT